MLIICDESLTYQELADALTRYRLTPEIHNGAQRYRLTRAYDTPAQHRIPCPDCGTAMYAGGRCPFGPHEDRDQ